MNLFANTTWKVDLIVAFVLSLVHSRLWWRGKWRVTTNGNIFTLLSHFMWNLNWSYFLHRCVFLHEICCVFLTDRNILWIDLICKATTLFLWFMWKCGSFLVMIYWMFFLRTLSNLRIQNNIHTSSPSVNVRTRNSRLRFSKIINYSTFHSTNMIFSVAMNIEQSLSLRAISRERDRE